MPGCLVAREPDSFCSRARRHHATEVAQCVLACSAENVFILIAARALDCAR